jgi:hypothetical protein
MRAQRGVYGNIFSTKDGKAHQRLVEELSHTPELLIARIHEFLGT